MKAAQCMYHGEVKTFLLNCTLLESPLKICSSIPKESVRQ